MSCVAVFSEAKYINAEQCKRVVDLKATDSFIRQVWPLDSLHCHAYKRLRVIWKSFNASINITSVRKQFFYQYLTEECESCFSVCKMSQYVRSSIAIHQLWVNKTKLADKRHESNQTRQK